MRRTVLTSGEEGVSALVQIDSSLSVPYFQFPDNSREGEKNENWGTASDLEKRRGEDLSNNPVTLKNKNNNIVINFTEKVTFLN